MNRFKRVMILLLSIAAILSFSSCTSDFPEAEVGQYNIDSYESYLQQAKDNYEIRELSNAVTRDPIEPINEIAMPRYTSDKYGIYHSSESGDGVATIMLAGDLMCRSQQQDSASSKYGEYDFTDSFCYLKNVLQGCDLLAGNLETTLSESTKYTYEENKTEEGNLNRNAPSTYLDTLRAIGFDYVATANNHCLDGGVTGIYETICHLNQYGLIHNGTYMNAQDRDMNAYTIIDVEGINVAFLSYGTFFNRNDSNITEQGQECLINRYSKEKATSDIKAAKEAGAEYVIVYMHWGTENTHSITSTQRTQAQELADAGADFIAGSHPHVIQPYEKIQSASGKTVRVIYSMGNLISSMDGEEQRESAIILLKLTKENDRISVKTCSYIPCYTPKMFKGKEWTVVPLVSSYSDNYDFLANAKYSIMNDIGANINISNTDISLEDLL